MKKEKVFTPEELSEIMGKATRAFFKEALFFEELFGTPTFGERQSKLVLKIVKLIDKESKAINEERKMHIQQEL